MERAEALLNAAEVLAQANSQIDHLRIRFVGWQDPRVRQRVANSPYLRGMVTLEPYVSHSAAIRQMRKSSLLLLLQGKGTYWGQFHAGKSFEYIRSGVPILAIVPDGADADLVRKTGTGCVVDPADPVTLRNVLWQVMDDYDAFKRKYYRPKQAIVTQYERRVLVKQLAALFTEVACQ
jgi:glycosyltransferase involved in cell wall biosynthesis